MLFNSFSFLLFFLAVVLVSRFLVDWTGRKIFLLLASYLFYATWNPPFVALIWISTLLDWHAGKWMYRSKTIARRRLFLGMSLLGNLGILAYFKYAGFFLENLQTFLAVIGFHADFGRPGIMLPVGISFYTFQTLSYTLDMYREKITPCKNFLDYALFVTFFPQLMAGPIMRSADFLPQCQTSRVGNAAQIGWGLILMVIGLFSKVVVADGLMTPVVEQVFGADTAHGFLTSWAGALAFSSQIFCDFFGYSTCAVGVALCLGFSLTENFRFPYAAIGFSDFWQRWHISLSFWLRDYLFLPTAYAAARRLEDRKLFRFRLRQDYWSYAVATMITMLVAGLWHGASWLFVIWGGIHGVCLVVERSIRKTRLAAFAFWRSRTGRAGLGLTTFLLVSLAWVFFRAQTASQAFSLIADMVNIGQGWETVQALARGIRPAAGSLWLGGSDYTIVFAGTALLLLGHWRMRDSDLQKMFHRIPPALQIVLVTSMLYLVLIALTGEDRAFLYFQF